MTGDGVPELLFTEMGGFLTIYYCRDGHYETQMPLTGTYHNIQPDIIIKDLNQNGIDEIITIAGDDRFQGVDVFEWSGTEFQNLNWNDTDDFTDDLFQPCYGMLGPSSLETVDIDGNGTLELVLKQAIPIWSEYIEGLPWRKETRTCAWNGERYVLAQLEFSPPEYRFQAVQDGDRFALIGEYDRAMDFYQQAIFSDQLDWWSSERKQYETQLALDNPTPQPTPVTDDTEYYYLAAYARFRIILLHILRGYLPEARIVYDTLQDKFPAGQPGHEFAEMATLFWDEFQASSNIRLACNKAIDHATTNPNILTYLGNGHHGWQSHTYVPDDACPFTTMP